MSIAQDFGVTPGAINNIKTGETWSHITGIKKDGKCQAA